MAPRNKTVPKRNPVVPKPQAPVKPSHPGLKVDAENMVELLTPEPIIIRPNSIAPTNMFGYDELQEEVHEIEWPEKQNNAIIIQSCVPKLNNFDDALNWLKPIHGTYAKKWKMDYLANTDPVIATELETYSPAWDKIPLIRRAIARGYEYVFWIDHDCVIVRFDTDLREALDDDSKDVFMCIHPGFPMMGLLSHFNAGVMAIRGNANTARFFDLVWDGRYSGPPWYEQDVMNGLFREFEWMDKVGIMGDRYSSTPNANEVPIEHCVIAAFHGVGDLHNVNIRLEYMKKIAEHCEVEKQMAEVN